MVSVVINYRRSDAPAYAGLLHDWIGEHFGYECIVREIDDLEHGDIFESIRHRVGSAEVMIVVIGKAWLLDTDAYGRRRLDDRNDLVRLEIEAALQQGIPVIPVLVGGATMPSVADLPAGLAALARRNPLVLPYVGSRLAEARLLMALEPLMRESVPHGAPAKEEAEAPSPPPAATSRRSLVTVPDLSAAWRRIFRRSRASRPASLDQLATKREKGRFEPIRDTHDIPAADVGDIVDCTVFAPPLAAPGRTILVQVFAHLIEQSGNARALAEEFDADAERRAFKTLEAIVRRGSTLHLDLRMRRLKVVDPVQSLVWTGRPGSVQFEVEVPEDAGPGTVVGTVTVSLDSVPIGHVKFKLAVGSAEARRNVQSEPVGDDAKRYSRAFISYSSKDRRKVLERVQVLRLLGIDCFQDLLDLDPGERWEQELYLGIAECDLFLLFWSSDAKASQWVRKEARYALERQGGDDYAAPEIRPVIIEGPPIPHPWPELDHLHFGDHFVYLLAGVDT